MPYLIYIKLLLLIEGSHCTPQQNNVAECNNKKEPKIKPLKKSSLYDLIEKLVVTWVRADIWNPILVEARHLLSLVLVLPLIYIFIDVSSCILKMARWVGRESWVTGQNGMCWVDPKTLFVHL
ncbi:hypothetical protein Hanom_Chr04g00374861 [Helianthus anomalus]